MKLGQLFPPLSAADVRAHWLSGDHVCHHGDPARLPDLADMVTDLREFVQRFAYHCTFSAFRADSAGELAPLHGITADQALLLYGRGHTIQCAGTHDPRLTPPLCRELGIPHVNTTIRHIFSPPDAVDAFGWHFDTANVIAVQLAGSKRWQLADKDRKSVV